MRSIQAILLFCLFILSCKTEPKAKPYFVHDIQEGPTPWTSDVFEETETDFTFALISDLNGGEREGIYSRAVTQLNSLDPTFVLSVGDLIDGGTADTVQLAKEWDSFDARTAKLKMPFFYLGGNHDLTHPAMRTFWKNRYGPRYYHFMYRDVLFLMMDSEDFEEKRMMEIFYARDTALRMIRGEIEGIYEEGTYYNMPERSIGAMGAEQLAYFKGVLEANPDVKWTFVLMHKPLWMREDEKGLGQMEALLANRPYTVINGHFHSLSHRKRHNRDYIILGTTGGSQHAGDSLSMDHITLVRILEEPEITHVKMDGILDMTGSIPE